MWRDKYLGYLIADRPDRPISHQVFSYFLEQITDNLTLNHVSISADAVPITSHDCVSIPRNTTHYTTDLSPKTVIVKLNGGLATTLGCHGAKCNIIIDTQKQLSFLSYCLDYYANRLDDLWFFNSYHTHPHCQDELDRAGVRTLLQNRWPCLAPTDHTSQPYWAPPGHGDLITVLADTGLVDTWLQAGYEQLFISNIDNIGAQYTTAISQYMAQYQYDALIEVAPRLDIDKKGGQFVRLDQKIGLVEGLHAVNSDLINTNSLWLSLSYLKGLLQTPIGLTDVILNPKVRNDTPIIQVESAIGSLVRHIKRVGFVPVSRDRFIPVKTQADLLAAQKIIAGEPSTT